MAGRCIKYMTFLSLLCILCSCELVCICPPNCTVCCNGCCSCGGSQSQNRLVVQALLPQGHSAESFTLRFNNEERKFYGNEVTIAKEADYSDFLLFNNDGESVIIEGITASTNLEYGSDTLRYQPTPFYSLFQPHTLIKDVDTLRLELVQRVFEYELIVELINNDGRVAGISKAVICGMAKELNLLTGTLSGEAVYRFDMDGDSKSAKGTMLSFGPNSGKQELILYFHRDNGEAERYSIPITELIQPLTKGGTVKVVIDVAQEISETPNPIGGGMGVGLEDWDNSTNRDIIL